MTTSEVLKAVRKVLSQHKGSEKDLYEALMAEAEGWSERLSELETEENE